MGNFLRNLHLYLETIPDRLYPFAHKIEGKLVRGRRAYKEKLEQTIASKGVKHIDLHILIYRSVWHFIGALFLVLTITYINEWLFGTAVAFYTLIAIAIVALLLQEFLLHPRRYGQSFSKGVVDVCTWVIPIMLYTQLLS